VTDARPDVVEIVRHHAVLCASASLLPLWWAASPSITALQLKMLSELSRAYGIEFSQEFGKPLIASLAGGGMSLWMSRSPAMWAVKGAVMSIPIIGVPLRYFTGPAIIAGYTWVLGQAFIRHYESGGTYLDFHVGKLREEIAHLVPLTAARS
jgi:uncharacterized protein (DUF697 family)